MVESNWAVPETLPDLSEAEFIGVDTETRDPNLMSKGPGGFRGDGHLAGISLATELGHKLYLPIGHEGGGNLDKKLVIRYVNEQLSRPRQAKVGANFLYDLEWLHTEGIQVVGPKYDVQVAEPLLDENKLMYNLDSLATEYLGRTKDEALLKAAVAEQFGKKAKVKENLWRLHSRFVGPYAEVDAVLPIEIFLMQRERLKDQDGLWELFLLETDLIPVLFDMRKRGVRVDVDRAEEVKDGLRKEQAKYQKELNYITGCEVNVNAGASIAKAFDDLGLPYNRTKPSKTYPNGNPSFTKKWLQVQEHKVPKLIVEIRSLQKVGVTTIDNAILGSHVNGRIHCQFNQLKSDDFGTVTGRFSSSNPNLQQVPKHGNAAKLIRSLFIPDEGENWYRFDWSQIEYRLLVHYAADQAKRSIKQYGEAFLYESALRAMEAYIKDPTTCYHSWVAELVGLDRDPAKTINFGLAYGMGAYKLSLSLGITLDEAYKILDKYHGSMTFIKPLTELTARIAENRGYVKTILNRRRRFNLWEPAQRSYGKDKPVGYPLAKAQEVYRDVPLKRAYGYKALNAILQGSSADLMKTAMVEIHKSGICDVIGPPSLTVHDELDGSAPRTKEAHEALCEMRYIMENCIPLHVPIIATAEIGPNWGDAKLGDFVPKKPKIYM